MAAVGHLWVGMLAFYGLRHGVVMRETGAQSVDLAVISLDEQDGKAVPVSYTHLTLPTICSV